MAASIRSVRMMDSVTPPTASLILAPIAFLQPPPPPRPVEIHVAPAAATDVPAGAETAFAPMTPASESPLSVSTETVSPPTLRASAPPPAVPVAIPAITLPVVISPGKREIPTMLMGTAADTGRIVVRAMPASGSLLDALTVAGNLTLLPAVRAHPASVRLHAATAAVRSLHLLRAPPLPPSPPPPLQPLPR